MNKLSSFFRLIRPRHWIKNILLFAPAFFSGHFFSWQVIWHLVLGFFAFTLIAGIVYIINDFLDQKKDRLHPVKKYRPIASGAISSGEAWMFAGFLAACAGILTIFLPIEFGLVLGVYFLANLVYSLAAKHIVVIDILTVALMYFLRILWGALIVRVDVSAWIFITVFFGALFLTSTKRFAEFRAIRQEEWKREVMGEYVQESLIVMFTVSMAASLLAYSLYTVDRGGVYFYSIILVTYVYFRYAHLVIAHGGGEEPETLLVGDNGIRIAAVCWFVFSLFTYYQLL